MAEQKYEYTWHVTRGDHAIEVKADSVFTTPTGDLIFVAEAGYIIHIEAAGVWKTCTMASQLTGGTDHVVSPLGGGK